MLCARKFVNFVYFVTNQYQASTARWGLLATNLRCHRTPSRRYWAVGIFHSQPTRCGHMLRAAHCRDWRVAAPHQTLQKHKGKSMKAKPEIRSAWIKLCVTPAEKTVISTKAEAQGQTLTDFIRQRTVAIVCWKGS